MGLFVLTCLDQPDALSLRMSVRDAHLAYVRATHPAVRLGGPFLNADGAMIGSMMIVEAENMAAAEAFSAADPYRTSGLFESVTIRPSRAVVGEIA